jgi:isoquinoline 1-oxidoreductase subunit alpha
MIKLTLNGQAKEIDVADDTPLLWVLRDTLGLTGTKFGCGMALCGACTVHVEGQPTRSCGSESLDRAASPSMRLLPIGPDHVGRGAALQESQPERCGYRCGHVGQHLSLRNVSENP